MQNRQIRERRKEIAKNAEQTTADFKSKNIKATTAAKVISILNTL